MFIDIDIHKYKNMPMSEVFVYSGLIVLLSGVIYGLVLAFKKYKSVRKAARMEGLYPCCKPDVFCFRSRSKIWAVIMIVGMIFVCIGIYLAETVNTY